MKTEQISLLYYLKRDSGPFHLEVTREGSQSVKDNVPPFPSLFDNDPLSRVIKGRIATDAGITVKDVLLLVQRDEYLFSDDSLCIIANPDVERAWQQAFVSYLKDGKSNLLLLSKQMSVTGELARMDPLFFCKRTTVFFSPPCPTCGLPLGQCEDDALLTLAGLKPYTQSLKRYLYCDKCSGPGAFQFYAYETDNQEPAVVENRFGLIERLNSLARSPGETSGLPCRTCRFKDECYGPEQKAPFSMVPFAFYPFYMLIVSPPSLTMWNVAQREEKENIITDREHALRLGWSLVASVGKGQNEQLSTTGVPQKLEMLREGVKEGLVLPDSNAVSMDSIAPHYEIAKDETPEKAPANDEICRLLGEIRRDWSDRLSETPSRPLAEPPVDEDTDMEESVETVFLTLADLEKFSTPYTAKTEDTGLETVMQSPARPEPPEDTDKTVILSAAPVENISAEKQIDMEKTVILNIGETVEAAPVSTAPAAQEENEALRKDHHTEIEETVIISADYHPPGSDAGAIAAATAPGAGTIQADTTKKSQIKDKDDLIEATVILNVSDRSKIKGNR